MNAERTVIHHQIPLEEDLKGCARLTAFENTLRVQLCAAEPKGGHHSCCLPDTEDSRPTAGFGVFDPEVSVTRLSSVASRLLDLDGQARTDFIAGLLVSKQIPRNDPVNFRLTETKLNVTSYRNMRQTAAEIVRPILLTTPQETGLRPFQIKGSRWLVNNSNAILADDMGLGKTVQTIQALRVLFNADSINMAIVVCPKSVLTNWEEELSKWAPELSKIRMIPPSTIKEQAWKVIWGNVHVVLTSYEQLRTLPNSVMHNPIDLIVADEAHRVRNDGSLLTRGIRKLTYKRFWALSGTPIERDASDLATLLSIIDPNRFSASSKNTHPIALRAEARPYILRRMKADVLKELPDVMESTEILELLPKQHLAYSNSARRLLKQQQSTVLEVINELRRICDYDTTTGESIKADRISEIIENVRASGEKAVVFSYHLEPLNIIGRRLAKAFGRDSYVDLRGSMTATERDEAQKRLIDDKGVTSLLCSSRVGSEGITLTAANHVIFFNEWWNPSSNYQARDRVVRIGQKRKVQLYRFICKSTIEEDLEFILKSKSNVMIDLVDRLADPSTGSLELTELIQTLKDKALTAH